MIEDESTEDDIKEEKVDEALKSIFKSRKTFEKILNDKAVPPPIRNL